MARIPVRSRAITSYGYDAAKRIFEVEFKSGEVYDYFRVPASVHDAFLRAESKGTLL